MADDWFAQNSPPQSQTPPPPGDWFATNAPSAKPTIGPRDTFVPPIAGPLGPSLAEGVNKLRDWANFTQEGKQQHPIQAAVGRFANSLESMLFGETGALSPKPEGMKTGFVNNPVTSLVIGAPEDEVINAARDISTGFKAEAGNEAREFGNWFASKLRKPATPAQASGLVSEAGKVKGLNLPVVGKVGLPDFLVPEGELGTPTNPGPFNKLPLRIKAMREAAAPQKSTADLVFSGAASSSPESMATLPVRTMPFPGPSELAPPAQPNIQLVNKFSRPEPSKIVSPESVASYKVTYQSYPADQLVKMAQSGDVEAARELIRNPRGVDLSDIPNLRYILEPNALRQPWRNLAR